MQTVYLQAEQKKKKQKTKNRVMLYACQVICHKEFFGKCNDI